ncbi:hypothetical protein CPBF424_35960 [Xanthomonas euroxanthea]|uniref:Uncharacterized protein n=1 Tax=Xanthomonas euroxanthea TaxID=2259622 RepID=A0AA46CBK4_9XANT|nr:hypothetical protein CPBF424_35960 [Xanthomonas euroxanthea]
MRTTKRQRHRRSATALSDGFGSETRHAAALMDHGCRRWVFRRAGAAAGTLIRRCAPPSPARGRRRNTSVTRNVTQGLRAGVVAVGGTFPGLLPSPGTSPARKHITCLLWSVTCSKARHPASPGRLTCSEAHHPAFPERLTCSEARHPACPKRLTCSKAHYPACPERLTYFEAHHPASPERLTCSEARHPLLQSASCVSPRPSHYGALRSTSTGVASLSSH